MTDAEARREFAREVVRRLRAAGYQSLWAGGCVRDLILGQTPADYDVLRRRSERAFGRRSGGLSPADPEHGFERPHHASEQLVEGALHRSHLLAARDAWDSGIRVGIGSDCTGSRSLGSGVPQE